MNSSGSVVNGSSQTITGPQVPFQAPRKPSQAVNVNTVNGVKYESPVGSVLTVDADGTAHITPRPR